MKTSFGNFFRRLMSNGVTLLPIEKNILTSLVEALPEGLQETARTQLQAYNLVQREVDGRALNFYRFRGFKIDRNGLPKLSIKPGTVRLLSISFTAPSLSKPIHVTMHAVDGYLFSISSSQDLRLVARVSEIQTVKIEASWRSNMISTDRPA
jgi:hypothetical protein